VLRLHAPDLPSSLTLLVWAVGSIGPAAGAWLLVMSLRDRSRWSGAPR